MSTEVDTPRRRVGQPPRIHEVVTALRPIPGSDPVEFEMVEVRLVDAICDRLRMGVPISGACMSLNLSEASYHAWRARGRAEQKAGDLDSPYVEFLEASTRAIAESMVVLVEEMRQHGRRGDSRATEYMLRNRFRKEFGERHRLDIGVAEDDVPDDVARRAVLEAADRLRLEDENVIDAEWEPGESSKALRLKAENRKRGAAQEESDDDEP